MNTASDFFHLNIIILYAKIKTQKNMKGIKLP